MVCAGLFALAAAGVSAHQEESHQVPRGVTPAAPVAPQPNLSKRDPKAYFTDTELVTQDGKTVRFYSDVLKGRVVVMNTIFTHCKEACPLITEQMNKVRARLGNRFGKEIFFVSISSDPDRDTPQVLQEFARKHQADVPGWIFLTGERERVHGVLKRLGQFSKDLDDHSTVLVAWNFNTDRGRKMLPNAPAEAIAEQISALAGGDVLGLPAETPKPGN
jgi:cytochrome oxidase Cu insertion factor (SCO1/SenC/PrrC family)